MTTSKYQLNEGFYVCLGGQLPGLSKHCPFLITSPSHPTLPIVVKCKSEDEAHTVDMINLALVTLLPSRSDENFIQGLRASDVVQRVSSHLPAPFYPIYSCSAGYRIILRDYDNDVVPLVNGDKFVSFRRTELFYEALVYIILCADKTGSFSFTPKPSSGLGTNPQTPTKRASKQRVPDATSPKHEQSSRSIEPLTTSLSSLNIRHQQDNIITFRRNLSGIIDTLHYNPDLTNDDAPPSINSVLDSYFKSHGYLTSSVWQIREYYFSHKSRSDFTTTLAKRGMAINEAGWIWDMWQIQA